MQALAGPLDLGPGSRKGWVLHLSVYGSATRTVEVLDHEQSGGIMRRAIRQWLAYYSYAYFFFQFLFSDVNPLVEGYMG